MIFKNKNIENEWEQCDFTDENVINKAENIEISKNTVSNNTYSINDSYHSNGMRV